MGDPRTRLILVCARCGEEMPHNIHCETCVTLLKQEQDEYAPLSRRIEKLARRVTELERNAEKREEKGEERNERTT